MPDPKDTSKWQRTKKILWESNLNAPIRGAYDLMNASYADLAGGDAKTTERLAGKSFDAAAGVTGGSVAAPKPRGSLTMGANRGPRPARGIKSGSMRQRALDDLKQGPKQPSVEAKDVKAGSMRQKALDDLKQGPKKPVKAADMKSGGARATFLKKAGDPTASRKPRPGEKKFIGPENKPKPGDKKFIGPMEKPKPGDKNFIGPKNKPAPGEKDFIGPMKGSSAPQKRTFGKVKAGAAAGAGLLGYATYKSANQPKAGGQTTSASAPRDDRASSKSGGTSSASDFKSKLQGQKVPGSPTSTERKPVKAAGDKSRYKPKIAKAEKPMTNFERMKARQYEKEGYGGRSMTSSGAKAQVQKERGFKFKDLFKK